MNPYTTYPDIQGIIYEDEINRNRLMRTDELHKFSDGTLNHQRARVMINAIDKKLRDRRLMRNLEKFIGRRPYGGDLRLLERTI
ncbi:hypothetical protein Tco_1118104 [Tanacetum coccineum]